MLRRSGSTLLELLVVIAIVGLLLALLLAAVQRIRESAARAQSMHNLRQIVLGCQQFGAEHAGRVPGIEGAGTSANPKRSLLVSLLPYLGEENLYNSFTARPFFPLPVVSIYVSPADPSAPTIGIGNWTDVASYAANAQAFTGDPSLSRTFVDGTANTIAFAEHYSTCGLRPFLYEDFEPYPAYHRATFADGGPIPSAYNAQNCGDDYPITSAGKSKAAFGKGWTFQVAPSFADCNYELANTPHRDGMLAALADGSVRQLAPGTSEFTYWGAVTPSQGEILPDWEP